MKFSVHDFFLIYIIGLLFLAIINFFCQRKILQIERYEFIGYVIVIVVTVFYLSSVGFYDELPSDIYKHLEYFKGIANQIETGEFKQFNTLALFNKKAQYWYYLPTLISSLLETEFLINTEVFALVNVTILLICIYEFSNWLFQKVVVQKTQLLYLNLLSVFFFATHFGINTFAFIRYYSIAPTILNYAIYLTAIVCLFHYLRFEFRLFKFLIVAGSLFFTAYLIHAQEAMFIGTIYFSVIVLVFLKNKISRYKSIEYLRAETFPKSLFPLSLVFLSSVCLIYLYIVTQIPLERINKPKIIDLSNYIGFGEDNFILNPRFQFYTVLTHWGLTIYILYILFYKKYFTNQLILLAGMLIPILTIFNPLFTNFFLRIGYSDVLWRFLYMLPLYFVAARLTIALCFEVSKNISERIFRGLIVFLIFAFILPVNLSSLNLPYSRIYSLNEPHFQARASYWQDLLDYLQTLPSKENIITDPITGYMVNALTKHKNRGYKFYKWRLKDIYLFDSYIDHPLKRYDDKLLIINLRKGMSTKTAKVSKHWNPHALKLTEYYSDALLNHLEDHPQHFDLLWEAEDIKIYRINY